ncbi:MAG: sporulation protein [Betaproteobacteria bacterium HGW-Betaproteobacteria-15]|nr:MAG: sporulation protein [Betaproteobacteria bacterium HGW-Betaproteobacteria-15]
MLKWAIWLLLLGNVGYFLWSQGHFDPVGLAPRVENEPERLDAQIRPEVLRLLNGPQGAEPAEPPAAPATAPATQDAPAAQPPAQSPAPAEAPQASVAAPDTACWQVGGFTANQADGLRAALGMLGWPANSWQVNEVRSTGRWVVYMGRFDVEQIARKKTELRDIKVDFREVSIPSLGPGLALGTFSSEAAAEQGMQDLTRKGVRTARVAQERPESVSYSLRLPAATAAQRSAVESLGGPLAGKSLKGCE